MENSFEKFKDLHYGPQPLLIGNAWNVQSARIFEQQKFSAVATSSAAVAETLGYADGEEMPFDEYYMIIRRITRSVSIPTSVDLESGYGETAEEIALNITKLANAGVAGINIEDTQVADGKRTLLDAHSFKAKLVKIMDLLQESKTDIFVNVRSDAFLLGMPDALDESLKRIVAYESTAVHGLFFPCISNLNDIRTVTARTRLPVNVMCIPGLPSFKELEDAGVKRISMGNFANKKTYESFSTRLAEITNKGSFEPLFSS